MKATGIVRRIDDLGRVVIPKEIRRTQHIRQGDPLEIFMGAEGQVIFKKYSPLGELNDCAGLYAEVLAKNLGCTALVCDRERILAAAGPGRREYQDKPVSQPLEQVMEQRSAFRHSGRAEDCLFPCQGAGRHLLAAAPILSGGDMAGAVAVLAEDKTARPSAETDRVVAVTAAFLARQLEE